MNRNQYSIQSQEGLDDTFFCLSMVTIHSYRWYCPMARSGAHRNNRNIGTRYHSSDSKVTWFTLAGTSITRSRRGSHTCQRKLNRETVCKVFVLSHWFVWNRQNSEKSEKYGLSSVVKCVIKEHLNEKKKRNQRLKAGKRIERPWCETFSKLHVIVLV